MTIRTRTRPSAAQPKDALAIPEFLHVRTSEGVFAYDPSDYADVQRVSALTGVPIEDIEHVSPGAATRTEQPEFVQVIYTQGSFVFDPTDVRDLKRATMLLRTEGHDYDAEMLAAMQPGSVLDLTQEVVAA